MSEELSMAEDLIVRHFDALLSPSEEVKLADYLARSADARKLFQQYLRLEGEQIELGMAGFHEQPSVSLVDTAARIDTRADAARFGIRLTTNGHSGDRAKAVWTRMAVALSVVILIGATWWASTRNGYGAGKHSAESVAQFSRLVDVSWSDNMASPEGDAIFPGTIEMVDGLAEIVFNNGTVVIVEGPARFDVASADRAFLHYGRLRSIVPPDSFGFTVESPDIKVVDWGTEFGIEVDAHGIAEVHVFEGEVEMYEVSELSNKYLLSAGQAVQFESPGWWREIQADQQAFVDSATLAARATTYVEQLREEIKTLSRRRYKLLRDRKRVELKLRNAPELLDLRRRADLARQAAAESAASNADASRAIENRKAMQARFDEQIRSKLAATENGKQLLARLEEADTKLAELKSQLAELRKSPVRTNKIHSLSTELRETQQRRSELRAKVRRHSRQLRGRDPELRRALAELSKAKREADKVLRDSDVWKLRQKAQTLRKQFLTARNKRLKNDSEWVTLGREIEDVISRIKIKRKQIASARENGIEDLPAPTGEVEPRIEEDRISTGTRFVDDVAADNESHVRAKPVEFGA